MNGVPPSPFDATAAGPDAAGVASRAGDERRDRDVRACRSGVTATRERVLHRRRGATADRDRPRTGPRPGARTSSPACFRFLVDAQGVTGRVRNRRSADGRWHGRRGVEDCWGRSVWAFGSAARFAPDEWMRESALDVLRPRRRATFASPAGDGVRRAWAPPSCSPSSPRDLRARQLLADAVVTIGPFPSDPVWPWPEERLSYANAAIAEALIAAGRLAASAPTCSPTGLTLLRWLLDRQLVDGHLSPVPVAGAGPNDHPPAFDQQPIEVAAMADACARAESVTGDADWRRGVDLAIDWFAGRQRRDGADVGSGHRRRLRWPHPERAQPQPGRRVDVGVDHHHAAPTSARSGEQRVGQSVDEPRPCLNPTMRIFHCDRCGHVVAVRGARVPTLCGLARLRQRGSNDPDAGRRQRPGRLRDRRARRARLAVPQRGVGMQLGAAVAGPTPRGVGRAG